jgi:hypothetical protein
VLRERHWFSTGQTSRMPPAAAGSSNTAGCNQGCQSASQPGEHQPHLSRSAVSWVRPATQASACWDSSIRSSASSAMCGKSCSRR